MRYMTSAVGAQGNYCPNTAETCIFLSLITGSRRKACKALFRYMDDMVFFSDSKEHFTSCAGNRHLPSNPFALTVKGNWQVFPTYKRGVDYLGYRIFLHYTLLRKAPTRNSKQRCCVWKRNAAQKRTELFRLCSFNSYAGWLKTCDSYRLQQKYMVPLQRYVNTYYTNNLKGKKHE